MRRAVLEEPEADDDAEEEPAFQGTSKDDVFSSGTRHFPTFDVEHPIFYRFERYLIGVDGGRSVGKLHTRWQLMYQYISSMPVDWMHPPPIGQN